MKRLWQRHRGALIGFVLAACVTLFFMVRIAASVIYWANPAHHDMAPQPWMTIGFVAQSWGLDPAAIDEKAGYPSPHKGADHPLTLTEIARLRGVPVAQIITEVQAIVLTMKAESPKG